MFGNLKKQYAQYPIFVYGTLRRGEQNYDLVRDRTVLESKAIIDEMNLYSLGSFPMMVRGVGSVIGDVIMLQPFLYDELLDTLDQNEGVSSEDGSCGLYQRELVSVQVNESKRPVLAWCYLGKSSYIDDTCTYIPDGDWLAYRLRLIQATRFGRYIKTEDESKERQLTTCP